MYLHVGHGTLDVALANKECIVFATDSRRSFRGNPDSDSTKKLFRLPRDRFLSIAGLVDAALPGFPDLTLQIPALLEWSIERCGHLDEFHWEDPPPPSDLPAEFARFWGQDPYVWWNLITGPLQTILNIAATFTAQTDLWRFGLVGIVAGYKGNGEPKLEKLFLQPATGISSWGKPYIGIHRRQDRIPFVAPLAWATAGVTELADSVLTGRLDPQRRTDLQRYAGIREFLDRQDRGTLDAISETPLRVLAADLIQATAERYPTVGHEPIQTAVIRAHGDAQYDQPITAIPDIALPADGTWHMGTVFTVDYPFLSQGRGAVFTFCEIADNVSPIPMGGNFFYGSEFRNARFIHDGGRVHFGDNNRLDNCELVLSAAVDETEVRGILAQFSRVVRQ